MNQKNNHTEPEQKKQVRQIQSFSPMERLALDTINFLNNVNAQGVK